MPPPIVIAHIPFQSSTLVIRQHLPTDATALSRLGSNPSVWKKLRNRMPHPYTPSDAAAWICQCNNPENWVSVKGPLGPCPTGNGGPSSLTRDEGFAIEGEGNPSLTSSTGEESSPSTNKDDKHPSPPTSRCQDGKDLFPQFFVIALDDTVIGSCSLQFGSDVYLRSAELGYWLGEKFWGRGIASRVAGAMVEWAWGTFGWLFRIEVGLF
ncbi:hypothetical protein K470DRAFT_255822 [Piedraia hortae CBS 480.64]|uniref:N-acetyltransferase domain-containing protein n=1 Tax=Piedraia hortae CBS 480.64 TaxID=1314780 RepID=A0A6A7C4M3_9PEZI|nr:hypothetical protein K470DRAFT_255822 [Piedraia hortae CBS 480.64]